jgi:hypothetical protein
MAAMRSLKIRSLKNPKFEKNWFNIDEVRKF